jgi:hypothetical protein
MVPMPPTHLAGCALLLALVGCSSGSSSTFGSEFDRLWADFDVTYPYFSIANVDWSASRETYRPRAGAAQNEEELIETLGEMLGELRDPHVYFQDNAGRQRPTWVNPAFKNYDPTVRSSYLARWGAQSLGQWGYGMIGSVPYVYVDSWSAPLVGFDGALETFRGAPGIVIDVRSNNGGASANARLVLQRLTDQTRIGGYVRYRNGPNHDDFTAPMATEFSPAGSWQYTKPVLLLVGAGSLSTTEDFSSGMRELPYVTLAGDNTAGASANAAIHSLSNSWSYSVSRWFFTTPDGIVVEGNGIPPHVRVPSTAADFASGRDPVLDYAVAWAANPTVHRNP